MQLFRKLWSVSFVHGYYKVPLYKDFIVVPTASCSEKIRAFNMSLKQMADAFHIFYKEEPARPSLLHALSQPLTLAFYVYSQDAFFLNYSAIELDHMDQCFLLSNAYATEKEKNLLHPADQLAQPQRVTQVSDYENLGQYIPGNAAMLRVCRGLMTPDQVPVDFFNGTYADFKAQYSFTDLQEQGCFSIQVNGGEWIGFYAMLQKRKQLFAILELTLKPDTLPVIEPVAYRAIIGAKSVIWRYYMVEKNQKSFSDFSIYAGKQPLQLKPITKTVLGNGSQAFVLESVDPIPLCEAYESPYEVEFNQADAKAGRLVTKKRVGLPLPDIRRIKVNKDSEGFKAYADMYLYI